MSELGTAIASALLVELERDGELAGALARAVAPHLGAGSGGWMSAHDTMVYLGLGSLDALDRLTRDGLPCAQPGGPGGRRFYSRAELDLWMTARS